MAHYPPSDLEDLKASAQEELIDGLLASVTPPLMCLFNAEANAGF